MMTVDVLARGLSSQQRARLGERMLAVLTTEERAPESVMDSVRALTHVVVHSPESWATGGSDDPRYLVRVTVPGAWHTPALGEHLVARVTAAVAEFDERVTEEPRCVVQIVGLRTHSLGVLGKVVSDVDITRLMTQGYRESGEQAEAPAGSVIDPVCGMTVDLATTKLTLDHDGVTYGFCAPVCRKVFAEELASA